MKEAKPENTYNVTIGQKRRKRGLAVGGLTGGRKDSSARSRRDKSMKGAVSYAE